MNATPPSPAPTEVLQLIANATSAQSTDDAPASGIETLNLNEGQYLYEYPEGNATRAPMATSNRTVSPSSLPSANPPIFGRECFVCGGADWHVSLPHVKVAVNDEPVACADFYQLGPLIPLGEDCDRVRVAAWKNCGCQPGAEKRHSLKIPKDLPSLKGGIVDPFALTLCDVGEGEFILGRGGLLGKDVDILGTQELLVRHAIDENQRTIYVEMEYRGYAWLGFAWADRMAPSTTIIGLPDMNDVRKYDVLTDDVSGIQPSAEFRQTLHDTSIGRRSNNHTLMRFTKPLSETWEASITSDTEMEIVWTVGFNSTFGPPARAGVYNMNFSSVCFVGLSESNQNESRMKTTLQKTPIAWILIAGIAFLLSFAIVRVILRKRSTVAVASQLTRPGSERSEATDENEHRFDEGESLESSDDDDDGHEIANFYKRTLLGGNDRNSASYLASDNVPSGHVAFRPPRPASFFRERYTSLRYKDQVRHVPVAHRYELLRQSSTNLSSHGIYTLSSPGADVFTNNEANWIDTSSEVFA
jgi:hypothetical protein